MKIESKDNKFNDESSDFKSESIVLPVFNAKEINFNKQEEQEFQKLQNHDDFEHKSDHDKLD